MMYPKYLTIFVMLGFLSLSLAARKRKYVGMGVLKIECDLDEAVSKNLVCEMKPLSTGGANLTFGVTLLNPADQVWFYLQTFKKEGKNVYKPTVVTARIELCDFFGGKENGFLSKFLSTTRTAFENYIHPCPYKDRVIVENFTVNGEVVSKYLPRGSYRFDYYINSVDNLTYFSMKYYFYINKGI